MSFVYRNGNIVPLMNYNKASRLYHRFDKYWGTTTVNDSSGVPTKVYQEKRTYYSYTFIEDTVSKRFMQGLGYSWTEFLSQPIQNEIESMYYKYSADYKWDGSHGLSDTWDEPTQGLIPPTATEIASALNNGFDIGEEIEVTVSYGGGLNKYVDEHELGWEATATGITITPFNSDTVREILHGNPWYFFANSRHLDYAKNSNPYFTYNGSPEYVEPNYVRTHRNAPICDVANNSDSEFGVWALIGDNDSFELEVDEQGKSILYDERTTTTSVLGEWGYVFTYDENGDVILDEEGDAVTEYARTSTEVLNYQYTLKYTFKGVSVGSEVVKQISEWVEAKEEYVDNKVKVVSIDEYNEDLTTATIDTKLKKSIMTLYKNPVSAEDVVTEDSLYVYSGGKSYLKHATCAKMKRTDFAKMVSKTLDTGYTLKPVKKKWYSAAVSIVLVVLSVVAAFYTAGASVAITPLWVAAFTGTLATGLMMSGILVTIIAGEGAQKYVNMIGSFAQVVGYVSMATGIYGLISNAARRAATEIARKEAEKAMTEVTEQAIQEAMKEVTAIDIVAEMFNSIVQRYMDMTTIETVNAVGDGLQLTIQGYDVYLDKHRAEYDAEMAKLKEAEEEYNDTILNRSVFNGMIVLEMANTKLMTPDMLSDIAERLENLSMGDLNFNAWYTQVNSK